MVSNSSASDPVSPPAPVTSHQLDPKLSSSSGPVAPPPSGPGQDSSVAKTSVAAKTSSAAKISSSAPTNNVAKSSPTNPTGSPASPTGHATSPVPSTTVAHSPLVPFTGTTTSTITDTPESTLAKPSFISVVDSNGKTSFTAPPLVTILSTSREGNGSLVTFTHVVANPTGFSQAIAGGRGSFFHNAGAVAGVFLVIGVILTAIVAFATFIMCRRRRRRQEAHRRWLISVNRPRPMADEPQDPFDDPRSASSPPMRVVPRAWDPPTGWETQQARAGHRESFTSGLGLLDAPPNQHNLILEEPRAEHYHPMNRNEIGLAITTNESKPSLAQSSPSIYPPSLPAVNDDHEEPVPQPPYRDTSSPPPPPRPRRSHLRDAPSKGLLTPPGSVSDHSPVSEVAATSPWGFASKDHELSTIQMHGSSQLNEIMGRKTLLDVRPRSQESVQTIRREND
ncbi:hypothetical protein B0H12DRAFT_801953 [Mycena haematopus]|nr:hypothetical protein B0H12DRAFT_801953 [Mycena haematopus]